MNYWICKSSVALRTGLLLANGFERIVHGGRGDYVEILPEQICLDSILLPMPKEQQLHTFFVEYRTNDVKKAMVYEQLKTVSYADYRIGCFYISPVFLRDFEVLRKR